MTDEIDWEWRGICHAAGDETARPPSHHVDCACDDCDAWVDGHRCYCELERSLNDGK